MAAPRSALLVSHCFVLDSRNIMPGSFFVPLKGETQDGHAYIPEALEKGATGVFINEEEYAKKPDFYRDLQKKYPKAQFIPVKNTLYAFQDAARARTEQFPALIKIAITGSSGKTTTKEIAAVVFSQKYNVIATQGNLNTETGLPLSVLKIRGEHQAGIFELGMNRRGEIAELASVLCPQYAVITNIGAAHIGKLGSVQTIAEEKKQIFSRFTSSCVGFIPENDPFADFLAQGVPGKIIRYGDPAKAGVTGIMPQGIDGTRFDYEGKSVLFPLSGKYNLQNALAVIALARECGLSAGEIRAGLESVKAIFGRSQIFRGNLTIIQDCYNANPGSMGAAMEFFNGLETGGRKIFVLGDMLELGGASASAHRDMVSEAVKAAGVSAARGGAYLALMGPEMAAAFASQADAVPAGVTVGVFPSAADADMERAAEKIQRFAQKGDMVLLKGSRGMALERLTPLIGGGNNGV